MEAWVRAVEEESVRARMRKKAYKAGTKERGPNQSTRRDMTMDWSRVLKYRSRRNQAQWIPSLNEDHRGAVHGYICVTTEENQKASMSYTEDGGGGGPVVGVVSLCSKFQILWFEWMLL